MSTTPLIITPANDEEWLQLRTSGIGSSEIGTLLGYNKYQTPLQWWRLKTGRDPQPEQNDAMLRGHIFEDGVAQFFAAKTESEIIKNTAANITYRDPEHPWRQVTPDRFCWIPGRPHYSRNNANKFILECKTHMGYVTPDHSLFHNWRAQVMYQLGICGCPYGYIAYLDSSLDVTHVRIDFSQEEFDAICSVIDTCWNVYIQKDIAPDAATYEDVLATYPRQVDGKSVEFDLATEQKLQRYKEITAEMKTLETEQKQLKDEISILLTDADRAVDPSGVTLCTFRCNKNFNEEALKEANPRLYYEFCKPQPDKFDKDAFKRAQGKKAYDLFCTKPGARVLRIN